MSYILVSVAKNNSYAVRIVVDKNTNAVAEISAYGLYSIKAKEKGELFLPNGNEGVEDVSSVPYLLSTISISDFLEKSRIFRYLMRFFQKNVADMLGITRSQGEVEGIRYNLDDIDDGTRYSLDYEAATMVNTLFRCLFGKNKNAERALLDVYVHFHNALKDTQVGDLFRKSTEVYTRYEEGKGGTKTPTVEIQDNEELNNLIANSERSKYDVIR